MGRQTTSRIRRRQLRYLVMLAMAVVALPSVSIADEANGLLAHFRFDGNANDEQGGSPMELRNTEFIDNALYLNGIYNGNSADGYYAVCKTPGLDYSHFSVVVRFRPDSFGQGKTNIVTGGTAGRWFGMQRSSAGQLMITLNNQAFSHEVAKVAIAEVKWITIACAVDLRQRKVIVYADGKQADKFTLPPDFKLAIIGDKRFEERDKVWTFTNYSNANAFCGLVDELLVYGKTLSVDQLATASKTPAELVAAVGKPIASQEVSLRRMRARDERYTLPEDDVTKLLAFIKQLHDFRPTNADDSVAHREKGPTAIAAAAEKILALETDKTSAAYATARLAVLEPRVAKLPTMNAADRQAVIEELEAALNVKASHGLDQADANLVFGAAQMLEYGNDFAWAATATERLAKALGPDDGPFGAQARLLHGSARRLGLFDHEMTLDGTTAAGEKFDWAAYRGKIVLIDFWATWCGPCVAELPNVRALYDKYHKRGFDVVGISLDHDRDALDEFLSDKGIPWTTLHHAGGQHPAAAHYGVSAIPAMFLVGRDGKVVSIQARGEELARLLGELIPEGK